MIVRAFESPGESFLHILSTSCLPEAAGAVTVIYGSRRGSAVRLRSLDASQGVNRARSAPPAAIVAYAWIGAQSRRESPPIARQPTSLGEDCALEHYSTRKTRLLAGVSEKHAKGD